MRLFRLLRSINNGGGAATSSSSVATTVAQQENPNMIRKLFGKYLLLTNTLSAGLLMVAGDLAAQEYERRGNRKNKDQQLVQIVDRYDWTRVGKWCGINVLGKKTNLNPFQQDKCSLWAHWVVHRIMFSTSGWTSWYQRRRPVLWLRRSALTNWFSLPSAFSCSFTGLDWWKDIACRSVMRSCGRSSGRFIRWGSNVFLSIKVALR